MESKIEITIEADTKEFSKAVEKCKDAFIELGKALQELQNKKIKIKEVKPAKWWQFWRWF
jgi:hypothetical protein